MTRARCFTWKFNLVPSYTRRQLSTVTFRTVKLFTTLLKNFHHLAISSGREIIQLPLVFPLIKWNLEWLTLDPSHLVSGATLAGVTLFTIDDIIVTRMIAVTRSTFIQWTVLMILFLACGKNRATRRLGPRLIFALLSMIHFQRVPSDDEIIRDPVLHMKEISKIKDAVCL